MEPAAWATIILPAGGVELGVGSMDKSKPDLKAALDGVDESKRSALKRLIGGGAFATPIVASFAMGGLTVEAVAQASNTTASGFGLRTPRGSGAISDRRLKVDIGRVGTHPRGFGIYRFRYAWSDVEHVGVMAQEVSAIVPDAVMRGDDGLLRVDYAAIGMEMMPYAAWKAAAERPAPTL